MPTGKTSRRIAPSVPHEPHRYLEDAASVAVYLKAAFEEEDPSVVTMALRTATAAIGGMAELARRTGLSRETLYRTLSRNGNPRLDTLVAILAALGLRLSAERLAPSHGKSQAKGRSVATSKSVVAVAARKPARKKSGKAMASKSASRNSRR